MKTIITVLFLTAVLATSSVRGDLPQSIQAALERYMGMKTESLETVTVAATATNASVESILSEMNLKRG